MLKQDSIVKSFTAVFASISTTNGYLTNIGADTLKAITTLANPAPANVEEYSDREISPDQLSGIAVFDIVDSNTNVKTQAYRGKLTLEIHTFCQQQGMNTLFMLRQQIADVYKSIKDNYGTLITANNIQIERVKDEKAVKKADKTIGEAVITIDVIYNVNYRFGYQDGN
jgi:hypothetical protein